MKLLVKNDKGEMVKAFNPEGKFALRKKADGKIIDQLLQSSQEAITSMKP